MFFYLALTYLGHYKNNNIHLFGYCHLYVEISNIKISAYIIFFLNTIDNR